LVAVREWRPIARSQPVGYADEAGRYSATLSKPHIIRDCRHEQLTRLTENYPCDIFVGQSSLRIPPEYIRDVGDTSEARRAGDVADAIPRPTLDEVHDAIIDGDWDAFHGEEKPLFHFGPQRFDIACARIEHYTGVEIDTVQMFMLFTHYAMHTTEVVRIGWSELAMEDAR